MMGMFDTSEGVHMALFMKVTTCFPGMPDQKMLANAAHIQAIRPRAADDRSEIGAWIVWSSLDTSTPIRESYELVADAFDTVN